jgi:nucleoside-diphosphate-sugar epimerase
VKRLTAESAPFTLVTGGAGYVGMLVVEELMAAGRAVRVLDVLLHGQEELAADLEARGVEVIRGDVRDAVARSRALDGVEAVVHLAAIVGDPACANDPQGSHTVNVDGARKLIEDAASRRIERFVFASTCSNYGRMSDPALPITEDGELAPVSLYAEQKVAIERWLLSGQVQALKPICLRFATVYGVAPRMRFDLTVNEFTRELWANRRLEVFGEQFWRPYVHVRDAARAVRTVLEAPKERVAARIFNVGHSTENYRKRDLVRIIQGQIDRGSVVFVHRDEDPRDYKVSFRRIAEELGYATTATVAGGVAEIVTALDGGLFGDPFARAYRNVP